MNKTRIAWTEMTVNPIVGCKKVSEGCRYCYAERLFHHNDHGHIFEDPKFYPERLKEFDRKKPSVIFVCSMSDLFHEAVTDTMLDMIFSSMVRNPQHKYIILTKRPKRMRSYLESCEGGAAVTGRSFPWSFIWFGISAEDQDAFDERIDDLIQSPGDRKLVSLEPLLGPIDLSALRISYQCGKCRSFFSGKFREICPRCGERGYWSGSHRYNGRDFDPCGANMAIKWVIAGGETGSEARTLDPIWIESLIHQCADHKLPFFFKSWGEYDYSGPNPRRVGSKYSGNIYLGRSFGQYPNELKPDQIELF